MTSRSRNARLAGFLYILASLIGIVRLMYIPRVLVVHGDAAATAANIVAHEMLFRFGIVCYLFGSVLFLFLTFALYRLFMSVDLPLSVVMLLLARLLMLSI